MGVQSTLWALFFCYLFGGWRRGIFPSRPELAALLAAYLFAILGLNALLAALKKLPCHEENS